MPSTCRRTARSRRLSPVTKTVGPAILRKSTSQIQEWTSSGRAGASRTRRCSAGRSRRHTAPLRASIAGGCAGGDSLRIRPGQACAERPSLHGRFAGAPRTSCGTPPATPARGAGNRPRRRWPAGARARCRPAAPGARPTGLAPALGADRRLDVQRPRGWGGRHRVPPARTASPSCTRPQKTCPVRPARCGRTGRPPCRPRPPGGPRRRAG